MDRLIQAEGAVLRPTLPERGRRQHPETAGEDGRLVGQDVAEEVLGDDHVEVGRPADEEHRARVDELVVQADGGMARPDLVGNRPPEPRRREHVGLVDRGDELAAGRGELEGQLDDAPDLVLRIWERVLGGSLARRARGFVPLAEIDPTGELADDEQVDPVEQLRPNGR
jgi:hypothetical protein